MSNKHLITHFQPTLKSLALHLEEMGLRKISKQIADGRLHSPRKHAD